MMWLYSGTPGSGKSCHQAEDILEFMINAGVCVIANYEVNQERIRKHCNKTSTFVYADNSLINPQNLMQFSRQYFKKHKFREGRIRLYIDEAQLLFNAREWDVRGRKEWVKFFTQHRKYGYDIFLIAQFDRMLDRQVRSLIEYEYKHRRLGNAGLKGKALSLVLGGNTYLAIKVWYPMQERLGCEVHHIRKKYYSFYDSYKDFDTGESIADIETEANAEQMTAENTVALAG